MTFAECIPFLLRGCRIRKTHFNDGHNIRLDPFNYNILTYYNAFDDNSMVGPYEITDEDLKDVCWEVIE